MKRLFQAIGTFSISRVLSPPIISVLFSSVLSHHSPQPLVISGPSLHTTQLIHHIAMSPSSSQTTPPGSSEAPSGSNFLPPYESAKLSHEPIPEPAKVIIAEPFGVIIESATPVLATPVLLQTPRHRQPHHPQEEETPRAGCTRLLWGLFILSDLAIAILLLCLLAGKPKSP